MSQDPSDVIDPQAAEEAPAEVTKDDPSYIAPDDTAEAHDIIRAVLDDEDQAVSEHVEPDPHENPADQFAKAQAIEAEQARQSGAGGPDE